MSNSTPPARKSAPQIVAQLAQLDGWQLHGDGAELAIQKQFAFANFQLVMGFANAIAFLAERHQHHPELVLNYSTCTVRFHTHDAGGITQLDFDSAVRVDALCNA